MTIKSCGFISIIIRVTTGKIIFDKTRSFWGGWVREVHRLRTEISLITKSPCWFISYTFPYSAGYLRWEHSKVSVKQSLTPPPPPPPPPPHTHTHTHTLPRTHPHNHPHPTAPSAPLYKRLWTGPRLVQVTAFRLLGAKPLPEPMLAYCQLGLWEHTSGQVLCLQYPVRKFLRAANFIPLYIIWSTHKCSYHLALFAWSVKTTIVYMLPVESLITVLS